MHEFILENLFLTINETQIAENISMRIKGLCCLQIHLHAESLQDVLLIFSKTHMYAANETIMRGNAYFDGKLLPISKIHYLLNHSMIFEGTDIVKDVLVSINSQETDQLIDRLEIRFSDKRIQHLNVEESKIFELAVNLASHARIVFIKSFEISSRLRTKCLNFCKEYSKNKEVVFLIETEYCSLFDSTIVIEENNVLSLDKSDSDIYFQRRSFSVFDIAEDSYSNNSIRLNNYRPEPQKILVNQTGIYGYKNIFKRYNTENLIEYKHSYLPFFERLFFLEIYKINISQAFNIGFKRYEQMFKRPENRKMLARSIGPYIFLILITRILQEVVQCNYSVLLNDLGTLAVPFLVSPTRSRALLPSLYIFTYLFIQELSLRRLVNIIYNIFRGPYSVLEYKLMSAAICLSIFYQYSSIFEEDSQFLNYYMNITMTPGTYITSIITYIFFTHIITFFFLGMLFNNSFMIANLIYCTFTNLIYAFFIGKRMRSFVIGFYLSTFLVIPLFDDNSYFFKLALGFFHLAFPFSNFIDQTHLSNYSNIREALYLIIYCTLCYIMFCYKIFKK